MPKGNEIDSRVIEIINKIKDKAQSIFEEKLSDVVLFGSYTRCEQTPESDLDMMWFYLLYFKVRQSLKNTIMCCHFL